ncbi:hypothetical protein D1872_277650 [compost metagenome]
MNMRIFYVTADFTLGISIRHNLSNGTVALNLNGQLLFALQHGTHHCSCSNCAPKRSRCCRIRIMSAAKLLYKRCSTHGKGTNLAAHCCTANQHVFFFIVNHIGVRLLKLLCITA